jgi:PAS domain S-box-containing protein
MHAKPYDTVSPVSGTGREEGDLYRELFSQTTLPQALTDADGVYVMANTAYCDLVGYSDFDLFGRTFDTLTHPADLAGQRASIEELLAGREQVVRVDKRYLRADGSMLQCRLCMAVVRDATGAVRYLHGAIEHVDAGQRTRGPRSPERPAVAPLFATAREHLGDLLAQDRTGTVQVALLRLEGLQRLAGVIGWSSVEAAHTQVVDRIATIGGLGIRHVVPVGMTELLVLADAARPGSMPAVVHAALRRPLSLGGIPFPVNARIGVTGSDGGVDADTLLRQARIALDEAVSTGAPEVRYGAALDARALDDLALTAEITHALAHGDLRLHFQPKYQLDPFVPVGFEALLRWTQAERGPVPPERVVSLAESAGLISPLTCWVIDQAAAQAAVWRDEGTPLPVAVNIAPAMLANPVLPLRLSQAVTRHGLPTESLELEITETALTTEPHAVTAVHQLTDLGYRVVMDDFGTGYSSLAAVRTLPFHAIKLDRAFVRDLARDRRCRVVVGAIVDIARQLGSDVVAEGVEDEETLALLRGFGCAHAQGYHLGQPAPPEQLTVHLRAWRDAATTGQLP